ncbi:hypothetical protein [Ideonella sp. A 288]|uniref:hypothetical protein n=1 Tax=Ideonella sp. A 288 TaxID=1962181 RepID=UPI001185728A|nr:hypothetical protein [Ideonella sp. A 288]
MGIAAEIAFVDAEFVGGGELLAALCEQEQVKPHQAAGWFIRHQKELDGLPMFLFNRERQDFHVLEDPWSCDIFHDANVGIQEDPTSTAAWLEDGYGYVGGWLRRDLAKFFEEAGVPMPAIRTFATTKEQSPPREATGDSVGTQIEAEPASDDAPLATKERTTLLCIVGTIAREAKFDISRPSKAAAAIVDSAAAVGVKLGQRTVEEWLKRVPDALERRST